VQHLSVLDGTEHILAWTSKATDIMLGNQLSTLADTPIKDSININQVYLGDTISDYDLGPIACWLIRHAYMVSRPTYLSYLRTESRPQEADDILAHVGVSFISPEQACSNTESEIPNFDFKETQASARAQWNELLGRVQVCTEGVDKEILELIYSSVSLFHGWRHLVRADHGLFSYTEPISLRRIVRLPLIDAHVMRSSAYSNI
jgi:hypothetical protein